MNEQTEKNISNYFSCFYNLTTKWDTIMKQMEKEFEVLKNHAEQLQHIENANIDEFSDFPDLKENLVFKVLTAIDEDLNTIRLFLNELTTANNELRNKLNNFEQSTTRVDWTDTDKLCGTALHPSLPDLLQLAYEGWCIYNDLNKNLSNAIKSLDIRDEKKFNDVQFTITEDNHQKIKEIVALTQYCYESLNK